MRKFILAFSGIAALFCNFVYAGENSGWALAETPVFSLEASAAMGGRVPSNPDNDVSLLKTGNYLFYAKGQHFPSQCAFALISHDLLQRLGEKVLPCEYASSDYKGGLLLPLATGDILGVEKKVLKGKEFSCLVRYSGQNLTKNAEIGCHEAEGIGSGPAFFKLPNGNILVESGGTHLDTPTGRIIFNYVNDFFLIDSSGNLLTQMDHFDEPHYFGIEELSPYESALAISGERMGYKVLSTETGKEIFSFSAAPQTTPIRANYVDPSYESFSVQAGENLQIRSMKDGGLQTSFDHMVPTGVSFLPDSLLVVSLKSEVRIYNKQFKLVASFGGSDKPASFRDYNLGLVRIDLPTEQVLVEASSGKVLMHFDADIYGGWRYYKIPFFDNLVIQTGSKDDPRKDRLWFFNSQTTQLSFLKEQGHRHSEVIVLSGGEFLLSGTGLELRSGRTGEVLVLHHESEFYSELWEGVELEKRHKIFFTRFTNDNSHLKHYDFLDSRSLGFLTTHDSYLPIQNFAPWFITDGEIFNIDTGVSNEFKDQQWPEQVSALDENRVLLRQKWHYDSDNKIETHFSVFDRRDGSLSGFWAPFQTGFVLRLPPKVINAQSDRYDFYLAGHLWKLAKLGPAAWAK